MLHPADSVKEKKRYRLGVGSYAYRYAIGVEGFKPAHPMNALEFAQSAHALGASGIQLCENLPYAHELPSNLDQLRDFCGQNGLFIELGLKGISDRHLQRHIEIAEILGAKLIRVVLGGTGNDPGQEEDELERTAVEVLRRALPVLHQKGIYVGIENHFDLRTARLVGIAEELDDDHIGFVFDTTNGIGLIERPEDTLELLISRLLSIHIKDYRMAKVEAGYEMQGCELGKGWLDYREMLGKVLSAKPDSSIILELTVRRGAGDTPDVAARREADIVKNSFTELLRVVDEIDSE